MKVQLRQYEIMGAMSDTFTNYQRILIMDSDRVMLPEFAIPNVAMLGAEVAKDPQGVARELLASRRFITWMTDSYKSMSDGRKTDGEVAQLDKALHNRLEEMMWDTLTLQGQADLAITDVRETKLVECLTPSFASTVKNAGNLDIVMDFILILLSLRKTF